MWLHFPRKICLVLRSHRSGRGLQSCPAQKVKERESPGESPRGPGDPPKQGPSKRVSLVKKQVFLFSLAESPGTCF